MGIVLPLFAVAFNALLWLGRSALAPAIAARFGAGAADLAPLIAPMALLAIGFRLQIARHGVLLFVATVSLGFSGFCAGS